jgi:hypothetical protein
MDLAKTLVILGALMIALGLSLMFLPKGLNPVSWFGRLPGDIAYTKDSVSVFIPVTSMVIVSLVVSAGVWVFWWVFCGE